MGMGRGGYTGYIRNKKQQAKKSRESFNLLIGFLSLPLLPILLPINWLLKKRLSGKKKKGKK